MAEVNRRQFVIAASAVCAGLCGVGASAQIQPTTKPAAGWIDAGHVGDYQNNSLSMKYAATNGFVMAHEDGQIFAMTNRCSHKNRALELAADGNALHCPAHGSDFSEQGTATKGPARASLTRYAIKKDDQGNLKVDKSQSFGEKQWEDPASFVKV